MDKRIRESIEACRPGSDDLQSPELADAARLVEDDPDARLAFERVQAWDAAISKSLDEVSVPPGLAERILDRLRAAQDESAGRSPELLAGVVASASQTDKAPRDAQVAPGSPVPNRRAWSRRHWAGGVSLALGACVLVIVVGNWLRLGNDLPLEVLADQWREELRNDWQIAGPPRDFAVPTAILVPPGRWQQIGRFATVPVVAYELVHAKAGKAMLYVAHMTRAGLPAAPPLAPQSTTGGQAVAYWQSGSNVYVLVVEDDRNYRAFVQPSTTPLA